MKKILITTLTYIISVNTCLGYESSVISIQKTIIGPEVFFVDSNLQLSDALKVLKDSISSFNDPKTIELINKLYKEYGSQLAIQIVEYFNSYGNDAGKTFIEFILEFGPEDSAKMRSLTEKYGPSITKHVIAAYHHLDKYLAGKVSDVYLEFGPDVGLDVEKTILNYQIEKRNNKIKFDEKRFIESIIKLSALYLHADNPQQSFVWQALEKISSEMYVYQNGQSIEFGSYMQKEILSLAPFLKGSSIANDPTKALVYGLMFHDPTYLYNELKLIKGKNGSYYTIKDALDNSDIDPNTVKKFHDLFDIIIKLENTDQNIKKQVGLLAEKIISEGGIESYDLQRFSHIGDNQKQETKHNTNIPKHNTPAPIKTQPIPRKSTPEKTLTVKGAHKYAIYAIEVSTDGNYILSADANVLKIWKRDGTLLKEAIGHQGYIYTIAVRADSKYAATGGQDGAVMIWDVDTGKCLMIFTGHKSAIKKVIFTPDGRYVISASFDKSIRMWDLVTGKHIRRFKGHKDAVTDIEMWDSDRFISASLDGTIRIWNLNKEKPTGSISTQKKVIDISCIRKTQRICCIYEKLNEIDIWDLKTGQSESLVCKGRPTSIRTDFYGLYLFSCGTDKVIRIWEITEIGKPNTLFTFSGHQETVRCLAFDKSLKVMASGGDDKNMTIWPVPSVIYENYPEGSDYHL